MADPIFTSLFIEKFKILITAILIYVIIYALLVVTKPFGPHGKINSLVALIAAGIVSFSGVVTYAITYAINWFVIIFFIVFLGMLLLMFLGVKPADISKAVSGKTAMYIAGAFILLFLIIVIKSFFALNNAFDTNNPPVDPYSVDTSYDIGFSDTSLQKENTPSFWDRLTSNKDLLYIVLFFIGIGILMIFMN